MIPPPTNPRIAPPEADSDDEVEAAADDSPVRAAAMRALRETHAAELAVRRPDLQARAVEAGLTTDDINAALESRPDLPRALLPEERDTLLAVLNDADFPGRDAVLAQAATR